MFLHLYVVTSLLSTKPCSVGTVADSADEETRDIYAHFGLSIYLAQCLEHGIANALAIADLIPRSVRERPSREKWYAAFDDFMGSKFQATLGRLTGELREIAPISPELETVLADALRKRNWLAHHYFRERAEAFVTKTGRTAMAQELQEAQELFLRADKLLYDELRPLRNRFGLTDETLEHWAADYEAKARSAE